MSRRLRITTLTPLRLRLRWGRDRLTGPHRLAKDHDEVLPSTLGYQLQGVGGTEAWQNIYTPDAVVRKAHIRNVLPELFVMSTIHII